MTTINISPECTHILEYLEGIADEGTELQYRVQLTGEQMDQAQQELGEPIGQELSYNRTLFYFEVR